MGSNGRSGVPKADYEPDIVVVGGGPAGVAAAFSAARMGADVLIVEQFNCLGGVATAGWHGHICLFSSWGTRERVVGGIPFEMVRRVTEAGYGVHNDSDADFEVEGLKLILEQMAEEAGVRLLYHAFFCGAAVVDNAVVGVYIQSKSGRQFVRAQRVIDCSGDGDVAAAAGCGFDQGDEHTGNCQPATLMFTIGGVQWERVCAFRGNRYGLEDTWKRAQEAGDMRPFQSHLMGWWWTPSRPDQVGVNFTHVNFVDATSVTDLTRATVEARRQAYETIAVYRKYVPGMEQCYMVSTPNTIGLRESRRVHGEHTLTRDEVLGQATCADTVGYGSFFIDIHNCDGPGMDRKTLRPESGFKYQIPYSILVPRDRDNLLVAGRCASATHEALGSLRVMPQCGVMGQAAGVASVLSLRADCAPRAVDVGELQGHLQAQGCIVDETDVARVRQGLSVEAVGA
jgi:hypothetical protein